ncbi:hypothetical protein [Sphingobacterium faecium]
MSISLPQKNNNHGSASIARQLSNLRNTALSRTDYSARVSRNNPTAIVIMIDQSGSMREAFFKDKSKAEAVSDIVNSFLEELLDRCIKESTVRDYFDIMIIGYGVPNENGTCVGSCWEGNLKGKDWVKVSDLKVNVLKIETIETIKKLPFGDIPSTQSKKIWISPCAQALTPMKTAFELCLEKLEDWVDNHSSSFPPMVFNITDGYPTDVKKLDEIIEVSSEIKNLSTDDGGVLVFNCLLKQSEGQLDSIILPTDSSEFDGNDYYNTLYQSSSELPRNMSLKAKEFLKNDDFEYINPRGVILNSDANCIIQLLNIGTSTSLDYAE